MVIYPEIKTFSKTHKLRLHNICDTCQTKDPTGQIFLRHLLACIDGNISRAYSRQNPGHEVPGAPTPTRLSQSSRVTQ